jgi:hypothetical protein
LLCHVLREDLAGRAPHVHIDWQWLAAPEHHLGQALVWTDETERALRAAAAELG